MKQLKKITKKGFLPVSLGTLAARVLGSALTRRGFIRASQDF